MTQKIRIAGSEVVVDTTDIDQILRYDWQLDKMGQPFFSKGSYKITLGRFLLDEPTCKIEFRDGNSANYTRQNLIPIPVKRRVLKQYRNKGVKFRGVTATRNRYQAQISFKAKVIWLGYFETAEEAARAYDRKAVELYGTDAVLNFPEEVCTTEA